MTEVIACGNSPISPSVGDGRPSGLPAGHGAKTAPRERIADPTPEPIARRQSPHRWTPGREDEKRSEGEKIRAAIEALRDERGLEAAKRAVKAAIAAVGESDPDAWCEGRNRALAASEQWPEPLTVDLMGVRTHLLNALTLACTLNTRPLALWPPSLLEPFGLAAMAAA